MFYTNVSIMKATMDYLDQAVAFFRRQKRWSMGQLAAYSRLSVSTVSAIEGGKRGKKRPSYKTIERLASALGVTVDDLTGWRPDPRLALIERGWGFLPDEAKDDIAGIVERELARQASNNPKEKLAYPQPN